MWWINKQINKCDFNFSNQCIQMFNKGIDCQIVTHLKKKKNIYYISLSNVFFFVFFASEIVIYQKFIGKPWIQYQTVCSSVFILFWMYCHFVCTNGMKWNVFYTRLDKYSNDLVQIFVAKSVDNLNVFFFLFKLQ